jgi:NADH-quinone oxidoreductase subunit H
MIAEYANIVLMCAMLAVLFFGGWNPGFPMGFASHWNSTALSFFGFLVFFSKLLFFFFLFAMVKALVPRYRYDQLMRLGWKVFLPTSIVAVVLIAAWRMFGPGYSA